MTTFEQENNELMNNFYERTFYKNIENFQAMELFLNATCDLNCAYCYISNRGKELYPEYDYNTVMSNVNKLCDMMIKKEYAPKKLEIFSGEPFAQKIGFDAINLILEKFRRVRIHPQSIVIPSNYTFILSDKLTEKVEELIKKGKEYGIPVILSTSIDGKYCESNRPFKNKKIDLRNDKYYDKVFKFNKKYGFGFHPMIYSRLIENWKENFLWFQYMFKKYKIDWKSIYLLEVRNMEWSDEQIQEYIKFIKFLINWTYNKCNGDVRTFFNFIFKEKGFNTLSSMWSTCGRGIGCSIQSTLHIRMQDMAIVPCHRLSYDPFIYGYIRDNMKIEAKNIELMTAVESANIKSFPFCEQCLIKDLCSGQCLGSMYEVTGSLFTPIPSVCKLEHAKVIAQIQAYKELGIYEYLKGRINNEKLRALNLIEEVID